MAKTCCSLVTDFFSYSNSFQAKEKKEEKKKPFMKLCLLVKFLHCSNLCFLISMLYSSSTRVSVIFKFLLSCSLFQVGLDCCGITSLLLRNVVCNLEVHQCVLFRLP